MAWRYYAQRLLSGTWLDRDMLLQDVQITWALSGPGMLTATVDNTLARAIGVDGRLLLDEWSTAVYAEADGEIRWGGILTSSDTADNGSRTIECTSFSGYAHGRIYEGMTTIPQLQAYFFQEDAFNLIRLLWNEVQYDPYGNIGVTCSSNMAGYTVGGPDPGPAPTEAEALAAWTAKQQQGYELAWWNHPDIGDEIDTLLQMADADYIERHWWASSAKTSVTHRIELVRPRAGRRRPDLRFMEGENITVPPVPKRDGDRYANYVRVLGSGSDQHMLTSVAHAPDPPRVRRDMVTSAKDVLDFERLKAMGYNELNIARNIVFFDTFEIMDHPHAPIGSWGLGDEIMVQTHSAWEQLAMWVRITQWTLAPERSDRAQITVVRVDR